mgnify:FL=1
MAAGFKASLIKQFNYCNAIATDILDNNKSKEIQEYAKKFAEIESPLVGGTEAEWIRINWGDIYIFLCDDGNIRYQVDPLGKYGGELIDMWNCEREDFIKAILSLEEPPIIRDGVTIYESSDPVEEPDLYVPMKKQGEKKYITYEEPFEGKSFTLKQMWVIYKKLVEKKEYQDFEAWLLDMVRSGVFKEIMK